MAEETRESGGLGRPGRPMNRRSPFFIGMTGAAGVAITIGVVELIIKAESILVLIGLALFVAIGLDPVVSWLTRRGVPRWAAVVIVPRVMSRTVQVPATVTLVAVLIGGVLLGIVGALVAIPVAAALRLLLQEVLFRRLDNS